MGRFQTVVTIRDFSSSATCYAALNGRVRPEANTFKTNEHIRDEDEMAPLDAIYQNAVDLEIDSLARLSPCELMQIQPKSWKVDTVQGVIELAYLIFDGGDNRRIAVVTERPVLLGFAKRKFVSALKVQLSSERLSSFEVAALYD